MNKKKTEKRIKLEELLASIQASDKIFNEIKTNNPHSEKSKQMLLKFSDEVKKRLEEILK